MKKRFLAIFLTLSIAVGLFSSVAFGVAGANYEDINVEAKAALLVDADTGQVLYNSNMNKELYPASITKCMTTLLTLKAIEDGKLKLTDNITATQSALSYVTDDSSSVGIKVGETLTVEQLLYCTMVASANEACDILAEVVGEGDIANFVDMMNAEAEALGCKNTHFANPSGLQDADHYTSAWDIYLIVKEAMQYNMFKTLAACTDYTIPATNMAEKRHFYTTNYLLSQFRATGYLYKYSHGIKTGHTSDAGYCLVSEATKGSRTLISVVLGCEAVTTKDKTDYKSFSETKRLFEWGFNNFTDTTILKESDIVEQVPVSLSTKTNYVVVHPRADMSVLLPNNLTAEDLSTEVTLNAETAQAPITEGDVLGTISVKHGDEVYATADLLALNDVPASKILTLIHTIKTALQNPIVKILSILIALAIIVLVVLKLKNGNKHYRGGQSYRTRHRSYHGKRR